MKSRNFFYFPFALFISCIIFSCVKWEIEEISFPEVFTGEAEVQNTLFKATLKGEIKGLNGSERVEAYGHLWTENAEDSLLLPHSNITLFSRTSNAIFESLLPNVKPGETYYYRAYAQFRDKIIYGEKKSFVVSSSSITFKIDSILLKERTGIGTYQIDCYLTLSNLNPGVTIQDGGMLKSYHSNPTVEKDFFKSNGSFTPSGSTLSFSLTFHHTLKEFQYFRPFINLNGAIFYGRDTLFKVKDIWILKTDFGGDGRIKAIGFSIGNKGYIGTGSIRGRPSKDFWEYDPASDTWVQKADFGGNPIEDAVGFSIGNKGYIGTGQDKNDVHNEEFWEYDPSTNTWMRRADFPGGARIGAIGFSIDSLGYVGLGETDSIEFIDFWEYSPKKNQWTRKANYLGEGREDAVGFSIENIGYVGMGVGIGDKKDFWKYDPSMDKWEQKASFPEDIYEAVGFSIEKKGYVGTGNRLQKGFLQIFWEYDPTSDKWTQKPDFAGGPRRFAVGFSIGNKGYIGTGWDEDKSYKKDFWEYIPKK